MFGVEPQTSYLRRQHGTNTPSRHVRVKDVKVCAQQSIPNHLPTGS